MAACYSAFTGGLLYLRIPFSFRRCSGSADCCLGCWRCLKVPYLQPGASLSVSTFCITAL